MTKKIHVLYVDDDEDIIYVQQRILAHSGYDVSVFVHPAEALEHFKSNRERYDIAVVDFVMPSMNGDLLACELKKLKPSLPIILCTGFGSEIAEKQIQDLGLDGFLIKPIATKTMLDTLSRIIK